MKKSTYLVLATATVMAIRLFSSCQKEIFVADDDTNENEEALQKEEEENIDVSRETLADWSDDTHSNFVDPNYDIVFDQTKVNRIDIVITTDEYTTMQNDLEELVSSSNGPGGTSFFDENPVYVAADFYFNDIQWYDVGVRYKGNSTLYSSYNKDIGKLPLRFKFDYFEDEYPEIFNQRFYGFKDLSMSSNYNDKSFMREKAGADVFKEFGVPAARSAFYEVYMDYGSGAEYLGLYTMVEVVSDTMLDDVFGSNSGNCYKPDGDGAKFGANDFNIDDFEKKTNEDEADWSDIQEMYNVLHDSSRITDVDSWKEDLEAVFDVDGFLKYLAANNTIQNWDTYGNMTHNYYLYHDPEDDLIKWIVWDNNEAFESTKSSVLSFEMDEVSNEWPLISYIIDIPEYRSVYNNYISEFIEGVFLPSKMSGQYANYNSLISASATSEISGNTFLSNSNEYYQAVSTITEHCASRTSAANSYLD